MTHDLALDDVRKLMTGERTSFFFFRVKEWGRCGRPTRKADRALTHADLRLLPQYRHNGTVGDRGSTVFVGYRGAGPRGRSTARLVGA